MTDTDSALVRQAALDAQLIARIVTDLENGNRRDARLAIRMHADPAWLVIEVAAAMGRPYLPRSDADHGHAAVVTLADLRRLMGGPHG